MLLLTSTSDIVRVVTGTTGADVECHASWVDNNAGTITLGRTNTASIVTNTTTTIVGSPGASTQRNVKHLSARNNHASTSTDVTVEHFDGTTAETLYKATLLPSESLTRDEEGWWHHYDANGGEYPTSANLATQADMEGAASLINVVTPGRQHFHPGHPKFWVKCGTTGNILASYGVTTVTDTGVGLVRPNFTSGAPSFSSSDFSCCVTIERTTTGLTVTDQKFVNIRSILQLIGSVTCECYDGTATTAVQEDPTAWHIVGLGDFF